MCCFVARGDSPPPAPTDYRLKSLAANKSVHSDSTFSGAHYHRLGACDGREAVRDTRGEAPSLRGPLWRGDGRGLLRDLHVMANVCDISWTMIGQAAPQTLLVAS